MNKSQEKTGYIPVKGGLGNQMFFYAFGLYLNKFKISSILVWHEYVFTKQHNGIELYKAFKITEEVNSSKKMSLFLLINRSSIPKKIKIIIGKLLKFKFISYSKYRQSSPYHFDESLLNLNSQKIFFDGFWQNYKFLEKVKEPLLKSFEFNLPRNFEQNKYLNEILSSPNSVSIHIRRGDYLKAEFSDLNVIKSMDYFNNSIAYLEENIKSPVFYIFTDDIIWAKSNFVGEKFVFVEGNDGEFSYLDMFLMTKCKHNIISNSTFSFWGAWLNTNSYKIVVAPKLWTKNIESIKLCPPNWNFLEV